MEKSGTFMGGLRMMDSLIPQAVCLKMRFDPPSRLIDDYEIAAAIGLACREAGKELSEETVLSVLQRKMAEDSGIGEKWKKLLESKLAEDNREDWRRLLEAGYHYQKG